MPEKSTKLNKEVTDFLNAQNHPLINEIELLRNIILLADNRLSENIKWNGPNYAVGEEDRLTMKIQPPKQVQLIFHRGAKVKEQPKSKLLDQDFGLLQWRENDRAIASFKSKNEIEIAKENLINIISAWIDKTCE